MPTVVETVSDRISTGLSSGSSANVPIRIRSSRQQRVDDFISEAAASCDDNALRPESPSAVISSKPPGMAACSPEMYSIATGTSNCHEQEMDRAMSKPIDSTRGFVAMTPGVSSASAPEDSGNLHSTQLLFQDPSLHAVRCQNLLERELTPVSLDPEAQQSNLSRAWGGWFDIFNPDLWGWTVEDDRERCANA